MHVVVLRPLDSTCAKRASMMPFVAEISTKVRCWLLALCAGRLFMERAVGHSFDSTSCKMYESKDTSTVDECASALSS